MATKTQTLNLDNYDLIETHPNAVRIGDRIVTLNSKTGKVSTIGEPVSEYHRNPPGCKGKTHFKDECYDNIATVHIIRKKFSIGV